MEKENLEKSVKEIKEKLESFWNLLHEPEHYIDLKKKMSVQADKLDWLWYDKMIDKYMVEVLPIIPWLYSLYPTLSDNEDFKWCCWAVGAIRRRIKNVIKFSLQEEIEVKITNSHTCGIF